MSRSSCSSAGPNSYSPLLVDRPAAGRLEARFAGDLQFGVSRARLPLPLPATTPRSAPAADCCISNRRGRAVDGAVRAKSLNAERRCAAVGVLAVRRHDVDHGPQPSLMLQQEQLAGRAGRVPAGCVGSAFARTRPLPGQSAQRSPHVAGERDRDAARRRGARTAAGRLARRPAALPHPPWLTWL